MSASGRFESWRTPSVAVGGSQRRSSCSDGLVLRPRRRGAKPSRTALCADVCRRAPRASRSRGSGWGPARPSSFAATSEVGLARAQRNRLTSGFSRYRRSTVSGPAETSGWARSAPTSCVRSGLGSRGRRVRRLRAQPALRRRGPGRVVRRPAAVGIPGPSDARPARSAALLVRPREGHLVGARWAPLASAARDPGAAACRARRRLDLRPTVRTRARGRRGRRDGPRGRGTRLSRTRRRCARASDRGVGDRDLRRELWTGAVAGFATERSCLRSIRRT